MTVAIRVTNKTFSGVILSGADGGDDAYCTRCKVQFSVCHGGANDVCKHFGTVKHASLVSSRQTTRSLSDFGLAVAQLLVLPG